MDMAPLLLQLSRDVLVCTGGIGELEDTDRATLTHLGVRIIDTPVRRLDGAGHLERVVFADGKTEQRHALFLRPPQALASDLPQQIGCEQTEAGLIRVGSDHQTSVRGVYAAGDAATPAQQIVIAAALGAQAAMTINRDLAQTAVASESLHL
jgi:thioredoxin reductase